MAWDESFFKALYEATRTAFRRRPGAAHDARACRLDDHRQRLQLLACALAGEHLVVQAAEADGGWRGDAILLPETLSFAAGPEDNLRAYLLRVAWACTSRRLGFTLDPTAGDPFSRALQTWLAVPATREAMLSALPGAVEAERAACAAALAARPAPPHAGPVSALEALARLRLGAEPEALGDAVAKPALDWALAAAAERPSTPAAVHTVARSLLPTLGPRSRRRAVPPMVVPLWGWLLPAGDRAAARAAVDPGGQADALPGGRERRAGARDDVEVIDHPEDPLGENPLVHSFEKVHTIEQYTGGRKRIDASDELEAHGDALDEAAPHQVVRSSRAAGSVYQADALFADLAGDVADDRAASGVPYHEWDDAKRRYRTGWCRVRQTVAPRGAGADFVRAVRVRHRRRIDDLRALFERLEAARAWRLRQPDGPDIDVPERLGLRLVERVRGGGGPAIAAAIAQARPATPEAEAALLEGLLAQPRPSRPGAPAARPILPGVALATAFRGQALTLRLTGPGVTPDLRDRVLRLLEALRPGA